MSTKSKPTANGVAPVVLSPLDVLTLVQAAAYLQVGEDVALREAEAGRLPGRKVGAEWRFVREAIVEWLRAAPSAAVWPPPAPFGPWSADAAREAEAEIARLSARRGRPKTVPARSRAE